MNWKVRDHHAAREPNAKLRRLRVGNLLLFYRRPCSLNLAKVFLYQPPTAPLPPILCYAELESSRKRRDGGVHLGEEVYICFPPKIKRC